jgi:hypothetical protein
MPVHLHALYGVLGTGKVRLTTLGFLIAQYGTWKQAGIHSGQTQACQSTMYVFDFHLDC